MVVRQMALAVFSGYFSLSQLFIAFGCGNLTVELAKQSTRAPQPGTK